MSDTPPACPERVMAIHALADGELDALASVRLEQHLRICPGCRAMLDDIEQLRAALSAPSLREEAPAMLRRRIARMAPPVDDMSRPMMGTWRLGDRLGGAMVGALAACCAMWLVLPQLGEPAMPDLVVDGHVRSLQAGHLTDIAFSDRHVVKPWFNGRVSFAPPVVDLRARGFDMLGGRLDVLSGRDVAVLVYRRRRHVINLFVRPAPAWPSSQSVQQQQNGYQLARWTAGGLEFWAVSDADAATLRLFHDSFQAEAALLAR